MIFKHKKEKEVIALIGKHMDEVEACLTRGIETFEAYVNGNTKEAEILVGQVRDLESEADCTRHEIRDKLYSGAYLPLLREDIYRLVESIDKVANAGEACCGFLLNQRPSIPEEIKPQILSLCRDSFGIVAFLKHTVLCYLAGDCTMDVVRQQAKEIGLQESIVDTKEWDLTHAVFTLSALDFSRKIHLKQCLDTIVEVSDRAEDAADQLELVSLKTVV
ncbi:MAG: TIGR00153 family protein [Deltaproteobacteria bacterium]|nr:TIGR00153 family protein [Deltaproteobacteria bacterium]